MSEKTNIIVSGHGLFVFGVLMLVAIVGSVMVVNYFKYNYSDIWLAHTFLTNSVGSWEGECMIGDTIINEQTIAEINKDGELQLKSFKLGNLEFGDIHCSFKGTLGKGSINLTN